MNDASVDESILNTDDRIQIGPYLLRLKISYVPSATSNVVNGIVKSPRNSSVEIDTDRIYIGSDEQNCKIVISGLAAKHCLLYRQNRTKDWWIVDCASESGTRVNGVKIRNERLYEGDEIKVAGVSMYFTE